MQEKSMYNKWKYIATYKYSIVEQPTDAKPSYEDISSYHSQIFREILEHNFV